MQGHIYDAMTKYRFRTLTPDPDIVILDIDEKSLALMGTEFGRWPWPRDVLGAVLSELERQQAKAVIFDILFSDPDLKNALSEKAFSDAIASSSRSFFPVLRLNPANDEKSQIKASDLPGLFRPQADAPTPPSSTRTFALVPPYFDSAVASGRLGTLNIVPDSDGVIRRYHLWETRDGWDIISMPQRLASSFNWPQQSHENQLLQWMGKPLTHSMVSFSDLYLDSQKKQKTRPQDEFKGKIVIIGATAASLFDSKGSPLSYVHPGVDILATAIDNTKNDHFLQEIPAWLQILITFFLLTVMVWLSLHFSHEQLEFAFLAAPSILLLIAYLSMNVGSTFIDLSTPASITLIYFTIAKFYSFVVRQYWSGQAPYNVTISTGTQYHIGALAAVLPQPKGMLGLETRFLRLISGSAPHAKATLNLGSGVGWLESALQKIMIATWTIPGDDASGIARMRQEAQQLSERISSEFAEQTKHDIAAPCFLEHHISATASHLEVQAALRKMILEALLTLEKSSPSIKTMP